MKKANCVFLIGFILFLNLLSLNYNSSIQSPNSLESASDSVDDPLKVGTTSLGYDLDPAFANDGASSDIIDQVWEGLYAHNLGDPRLRIVPRLAADCGSWNENATVFNVTLRSGITFHNGEPFTATDVNYTFSRLWELCVFHGKEILNSYYPNRLREIYFPNGFNTTKMNASVGYGYIINKTVIVDDLHISFELNFPYAPFQSLLCFRGSYIMDASTTNTYTYLNYANIANNTAIGTGPYKIIEHTTDHCSFEFWEDYYRGIPAIKKIEYLRSHYVPQALLDGEIDLPRGYYSDMMSEFEKNPDIHVDPYRENTQIDFLYMNNMKINRTYRHAINYAIDYDKILNEIYEGTATRMTSIIPPGITYHKDCDIPNFNVTKARQILIEAGYTEGYNLDLNSTDDDWRNVAESSKPISRISVQYNLGNIIREDICVLLKENLEDIGIHVEIGGWTFASSGKQYFDSFSEYDMFLLGWEPDFNDPSQIINLLMSNTSSLNYAQVNDSWLQLAIEDALTITNDDVRKALYYEIQDYVTTDLMPYVSISYRSSRNVRANYVITQPNPMDKFYIFPFSWHGENTTFNDPYLELWCNSGSPPVHEFWPEPPESIPSYPILVFSICILVIIPLLIKKYKKQS